VLHEAKPTLWTLMPTLKVGSNSQVNGAALAAFLRQLLAPGLIEPAHAYIEKVNAMPGQGVTSMFNFGHAAGTACGVVAGLEIAHTFITPQSWKKKAGLMGQDKDAARTRAIQLWPWWRELDLKGKGQAYADAALIAYFGSDQHETTRAPDSRPASRRRAFV
jgi:crossover junction endodeoxyribonuclease RuvC